MFASHLTVADKLFRNKATAHHPGSNTRAKIILEDGKFHVVHVSTCHFSSSAHKQHEKYLPYQHNHTHSKYTTLFSLQQSWFEIGRANEPRKFSRNPNWNFVLHKHTEILLHYCVVSCNRLVVVGTLPWWMTALDRRGTTDIIKIDIQRFESAVFIEANGCNHALDSRRSTRCVAHPIVRAPPDQTCSW